MAYATGGYSRSILARSGIGSGYRPASTNFYTPSRQSAAIYGRESSSGPGTTSATQSTRLSLGGSIARKQNDNQELRQSLGYKQQSQSASRYAKQDYSSHKRVDLGISKYADIAKIPVYSRPNYRESDLHNSRDYSTLDKHSMSFADASYKTIALGSVSRKARESEKTMHRPFAQTENFIARPLESSTFMINNQESATTLGKSLDSNFEESRLKFIRF